MARHMTFSASKCLLAAAVLAGAALSGTASAACSKPGYPRQSVRLNEQGVTELAFLIRPDGTVERSIIRVSTGFPDLDRAAQEALAKCVFKPATVKGEPVQAWLPVIYSWSIVGDADMLGAKRLAVRTGALRQAGEQPSRVDLQEVAEEDRHRLLRHPPVVDEQLHAVIDRPHSGGRPVDLHGPRPSGRSHIRRHLLDEGAETHAPPHAHHRGMRDDIVARGDTLTIDMHLDR